MQAWSIREPIAKAAPKDRLLVLDLAGRRDDFWGYEYIKGQLHNFGGRINLHGDLNLIAENPFDVERADRKQLIRDFDLVYPQHLDLGAIENLLS